MMLLPIIHADAITCEDCGHFWGEVYTNLSNTIESCMDSDTCTFCNGTGFDTDDIGACRKCYGEGGIPCGCAEFMPVSVIAFEAAQDEWRSW